MGHGQHSQRNTHAMDNRRVTEGAVIIASHTGCPSPGIVGGRSPQQQTPHRPATSSMPGPSSFWPPGISSTYSPRTENGEMARYMGSTSPYPPPPATPVHSYRSPDNIYGLGIISDNHREFHDGASQTSRSVVNLDEGMPFPMIPLQRADKYPYDHTPGSHPHSPYEQQAFGNLESSFMPYSDWDGPQDPRSPPLHFNSHRQTPTPGRRRHADQVLVTGERSTSVPHSNGTGMDPSIPTGYTTFVPRGPPGATSRSDDYNPHMGAIFYHSPPQSGRTPTPFGLGGGRTVEIKCTRPSDPHRLRSDGAGDVEHFGAVPPNPRSDGMSSQPSRVQGSGKGRKTKLTAEKDEAAPIRKIAIGREPDYFQASVSQLPTASATTPDPTHLIVVPQSWYRCATKQGGWVKEAPIEFGGIKLTDAANKTYRGLHGCDESSGKAWIGQKPKMSEKNSQKRSLT